MTTLQFYMKKVPSLVKSNLVILHAFLSNLMVDMDGRGKLKSKLLNRVLVALS